MAKNLVEEYQKLDDSEKDIILVLWRKYYNPNLTLAMLPFLDRKMVIKMLCGFGNRWRENVSFDALEKLEVRWEI